MSLSNCSSNAIFMDVFSLNYSQLFRKMKALTDTAPSAFIKSYRLLKAKQLLENTEMNVAEAAYEVGFILSTLYK